MGYQTRDYEAIGIVSPIPKLKGINKRGQCEMKTQTHCGGGYIFVVLLIYSSLWGIFRELISFFGFDLVVARRMSIIFIEDVL